MALLVVTKSIDNNTYKVKFELTNVSTTELVLADQFGEPSYTFGGTFDPTSNAFLTTYFPDSEDLIADWVQFQDYTTDEEVQFTDGAYYRALAPVTYSTLPDWASFTNYALDSVIKYIDNNYYKAIIAVDFSAFPEWIAPGASPFGSVNDYVVGDIVKITGSPTTNYYKALKASPADFSTVTSYNIGEIALDTADGLFYEALINNPRLGTQEVLQLSSVTGTFVASETIVDVSSPGISATVVSWDSGTNVLVVDNVVGGTLSGSIETANSPTTGTGIITGTQGSTPSENASGTTGTQGSTPSENASGTILTAEWQATQKANPGYTNSEYWETYTDQDPANGSYWEIYTDNDPNVNASLWQVFTPSGSVPESTASFSVNKITKFLISGLPIEFDFVGPTAEANANDFAVICEQDIDEAWDTFLTNMDDYSGQRIVDLNA
jgi:hypothetical protein